MIQNYDGFMVDFFVGSEDRSVKAKMGGRPKLRTSWLL